MINIFIVKLWLVCNWYNMTHALMSNWSIVGNYSPIIPTGQLRALNTKAKSHVINNSLTWNVCYWQGLGLRFSLVIWLCFTRSGNYWFINLIGWNQYWKRSRLVTLWWKSCKLKCKNIDFFLLKLQYYFSYESAKEPDEAKRVEDEQTLAGLSLAHHRSLTKCQLVQIKPVPLNELNCFKMQKWTTSKMYHSLHY